MGAELPQERLPLQQAGELFETVRQTAAAGGAEESELTLLETTSALTRFANNIIHQNVAESSVSLSVRTVMGGRTARTSTNRLDAAGVCAAVDQALRLTRAQAPEADLLPMPEAQSYTPVDRFDAETSAVSPAQRADQVAAMVAVARDAGYTAAGICANRSQRYSLFNSRGLQAHYGETGAEFSVTMIAPDSSGWAKGSGVRWRDLDAVAGARIAAAKARASADPIAIDPGKYTVILEPAAVLDLLGFLFWDFGALAVLDQRSFLSDRVGTKVFGENITVCDDAYHPLQCGANFDGEGMPRRRVSLVENGWVRNLVYARQTAAAWNRKHPGAAAAPTGHGFPLPNEYGEGPMNLVVAGGETPLDAMIASTGRGILVTRLWYIREVDPYQKILTGMTRDGTFLIENGKIAHGLRNFRFNQSMVEMLNQVEAMSPAVRASGEEAFDMVVPAMKIAGFHFSEVTRF